MKKVLALVLSVMLLVAFTFSVGCKPAEEKKPEVPAAPAPTPAPTPAPAPEQKPGEPAKAAPADKPAEKPAEKK